MNLLDLMVKIGADDQASSKISGITSNAIAKATVIGNAFYDAAKFVGGKAVDMGKAIVGGAVEGYASYEQLTDGMKKLYRDASDTIIGYSQNAYRDVGISANKYMEGVAGFSAAMMNSVGNDSQKAAELSNTAMKDIADNANTFGKYTVDDLTQVYQALAKGQFQTLDNLNLGYGGTKEGMQQLIDKANQLKAANGETADLTIDKFSDMVEAIHLVQEDMQITGTTTHEAMGTIEGSANMAKAAWENLLTGIGAGDTEMVKTSVSGLVTSIFGTWSDQTKKREGGLINSLLPVVQNVGNAILQEIPSLGVKMGFQLVQAIMQALGYSNVEIDNFILDLEDRFYSAKDKISEVFNAIKGAYDGFVSNLDMAAINALFEAFGAVAEQVWGFIEQNVIPNLPTLGEIVGNVANFLMNVGTTLLTVLANLGPLVPMIASAVAALTLIGPVAGFISAVSGAFTFLTTVILPAIGMIQSFSGAIAVVTTLLGGPIPIIVALVGAIIGFIATNNDARNAILDAWNAIVAFFNGIPAWWSGVWDKAKETVTNFVSDIASKWDEFKQNTSQTWQNVKTMVVGIALNIAADVQRKFAELSNATRSIWNGVSSFFSSIWNTMVSTASNAMAWLVNGVISGWYKALEFIYTIPSTILGYLGNQGNLLWTAGYNILVGLWNGMASAASGFFAWVSSIAGTIASLKGPLPYDRKVLVENGVALMSGLRNGLEKGFENEVKPYVSGMALDVASSVDVAPKTSGSPLRAVSVQVGELVVREEADIDRIAERLYDLSNREASWSMSYSVA